MTDFVPRFAPHPVCVKTETRPTTPSSTSAAVTAVIVLIRLRTAAFGRSESHLRGAAFGQDYHSARCTASRTGADGAIARSLYFNLLIKGGASYPHLYGGEHRCARP